MLEYCGFLHHAYGADLYVVGGLAATQHGEGQADDPFLGRRCSQAMNRAGFAEDPNP